MKLLQRISEWFRAALDWLCTPTEEVVVVVGPAEMHLFAPLTDQCDLIERRWP